MPLCESRLLHKGICSHHCMAAAPQSRIDVTVTVRSLLYILCLPISWAHQQRTVTVRSLASVTPCCWLVVYLTWLYVLAFWHCMLPLLAPGAVGHAACILLSQPTTLAVLQHTLTTQLQVRLLCFSGVSVTQLQLCVLSCNLRCAVYICASAPAPAPAPAHAHGRRGVCTAALDQITSHFCPCMADLVQLTWTDSTPKLSNSACYRPYRIAVCRVGVP